MIWSGTGTRSLLRFLAFLVLASGCIFIGCDHGLAPVTRQEPGFGGRIRFRATWPPADSLFDLRVIAFRDYPPKDLLLEILANRAIFSDKLQFHVSEQTYSVKSLGLDGRFDYVVVAQQFGARVEQDWKAVGVYTVSGDPTVPTSITLPKDSYQDGIDILVDFSTPPPQPF